MQRRTTRSPFRLVAAAFVFATTACTQRAAHPLPVEEPVAHTTPAASVIENANPPIVFAKGARVLVKNPGGWQPSLADAMRADAGAGDYIRSQHPEIFQKLSEYVAQIFGIIDAAGHKIIQMNFACDAKLPTDDQAASPAPTQIERDMASLYLSGPVRCHDGGDCCFRLHFDPITESFGGMIVNGQ